MSVKNGHMKDGEELSSYFFFVFRDPACVISVNILKRIEAKSTQSAELDKEH